MVRCIISLLYLCFILGVRAYTGGQQKLPSFTVENEQLDSVDESDASESLISYYIGMINNVKMCGCLFAKRAPYSVDLPKGVEDFSVWGEEAEALKFSSLKLFEDFYDTLETQRKQILSSCVTNTLHPFIWMFNRYKESGKSFDNFYKEDFMPTYPRTDNSNTYITCLLRFYEKITEKYPQLFHSFVLSSGDFDVTPEFVHVVTTTKKKPMFNLKNEYLTGVIRINIAGSLGYIVTDMGVFISSPAPVLMQDSTHVKHSPEVFSLNTTFVFSLRGLPTTEGQQSNVFIYAEPQQIGNNAIWNVPPSWPERKPVGKFLFYAQRSLCSFVKTIEKKMFLRQRTLAVSAYTEDGFYRSFCSVNPYLALSIVALGTSGTPKKQTADSSVNHIYLNYLHDISKEKIERIKHISKAFGKDAQLYALLLDLNTIWRDHQDFFNDIKHLDGIVDSSCPEPSVIGPPTSLALPNSNVRCVSCRHLNAALSILFKLPFMILIPYLLYISLESLGIGPFITKLF